MSEDLSAYGEAWGRVKDRLKSEIGDAEFKSWLSPLDLCAVDRGRAVFGVPTRFMGDWVRRHY
ncbi:MAG: DnaA N-terminal domain-containing protein, partial [Alphaproteobacteria bacterium]